MSRDDTSEREAMYSPDAVRALTQVERRMGSEIRRRAIEIAGKERGATPDWAAGEILVTPEHVRRARRLVLRESRRIVNTLATVGASLGPGLVGSGVTVLLTDNKFFAIGLASIAVGVLITGLGMYFRSQ